MKSLLQSAAILLLGFSFSCNTSKVDQPPERRLLGDGFGISSASILVKNLDSTSAYYTRILGFTMPTKENYATGMYAGTLSASVNFSDFSSFELLSIPDSLSATPTPGFISSFLKQHEGVRYFSLYTSSIDTTRDWLIGQGYTTDTIRTGRSTISAPKGWDWDDGGPQWRSLQFSSSNPPADHPGFLQFIGLPYQQIQSQWAPYVWRNYYPIHPNGVVGMTSLKIIVSDLEKGMEEFEKMGLDKVEENDSSGKFKIANNHEVHLRMPTSPDEELAKILKVRGPSVYAIGFEVKNLKETRDFLRKNLPAKALTEDSLQKTLILKKEFAHGVQFEFKQESKEQSNLALIYGFKDGEKLNSASLKQGAALYAKYCSLCHGNDRQGYAADYAPSLKSHSLMATTINPTSSNNYLRYTIAYGRTGTAMAPYGKQQGGPMNDNEIELLLQWLRELSDVKKPIELSSKPITGNVALGKKLYNIHCASCHGTKGEGFSGPALGNGLFLATASDAFLHYTISEGRDSTPMPSFKDSLSKVEINALTAYIRSRASGWNAPDPIPVSKPLPKTYVLNPGNKAPLFKLRDEMYISAAQVQQALKDSSRMILLDARSEAAWHQTRIPGAVSVPYYDEPEKFIKDIPKDSTWIVVYCACPHAASMMVVNTLRRFGYKNTAILDEGILVWTQLGYPVQNGQEKSKK